MKLKINFSDYALLLFGICAYFSRIISLLFVDYCVPSLHDGGDKT